MARSDSKCGQRPRALPQLFMMATAIASIATEVHGVALREMGKQGPETKNTQDVADCRKLKLQEGHLCQSISNMLSRVSLGPREPKELQAAHSRATSLTDRSKSYAELLSGGKTAIPPSRAPLPDPIPTYPVETVSGVDACSCPGGVVGGTCYSTLAAAVQECPDGATVTVGGTVTVNAPIYFEKNVSFEGKSCNGAKAKVVANMNEPASAILVPIGKAHDISLDSIDFARSPDSGYASCLRMIPKGRNSARMNMYVTGCSFSGFRTKATGGSAIFIPLAGKVFIDNDVVFKDNVVDTVGEWLQYDHWTWGGGGALFIVDMAPDANVEIRGTWTNNHHMFQHGLAGAIKIDWVAGDLLIDGTFDGNTAADGGAVQIGTVAGNGKAVLKGTYTNNKVTDRGMGCRGGATRVEFVKGDVVLDGKFDGNSAEGRGAVIAINRLYSDGTLTLKGSYTNNKSKGDGAILSIFLAAEGLTNLDPSGEYEGNTAQSVDTSIVSIKPTGTKLSESQWKSSPGFEYRAPKDSTKEYVPAQFVIPGLGVRT